MARSFAFTFLLLLVACFLVSTPDDNARLAGILERAHAAPTLAATIGPATPPPPRSIARLIYPAHVCQPKHGANPIIAILPQNPQVGRPVRFSIVTSYLEPRLDPTMFIAIGTQLLAKPFDLTGSGAPGCSLMVAWNTLLTVTPGFDPGGMWHRSGPGRVDFDFTPTPANLGTHWFIQAAIAAPGENPAGILTTAVLELEVGTSS